VPLLSGEGAAAMPVCSLEWSRHHKISLRHFNNLDMIQKDKGRKSAWLLTRQQKFRESSAWTPQN
jgi:hypothetical protein